VFPEGYLIPKKWWKSGQEYVWHVTEKGEELTSTHFTDSSLMCAFLVKNEEDAHEVIRTTHRNYSFIRPNYKGWMIDCPDWIDRYGLFYYLVNCLEVFSKKKNYADY